MATQLWSTGPALIYVNAPATANAGAGFLGTCETKPQIDIDFLFRPVMNDVAGDEEMDSMYVGMKGMVTLDLGKFNYVLAESLNTAPNFAAALAGAGPVAGRNDPGDVGTLMIQEKQYFVLYIRFPYAAKASMAGMVPGYRFAACKVNKHSPKVGTQPHSKRLIIDCKRTFDPTVNNAYGNGRFVCFDNDISGLPNPS